MEAKIIKCSHVTNPANGEVTAFFENENWGPIVTGSTEEEAYNKLKLGLRAGLIAQSLININQMLESNTFGNEPIRRVVERAKDAEKALC